MKIKLGRMKAIGVPLFFGLLVLPLSSPANPSATSPDYLVQQGLSPGQIIGFDRNGIPIVCGTTPATAGADDNQEGRRPPPPPPPPPPVWRAWEVVPSVIRGNGLDTFRFEFTANTPVSNVFMTLSYLFTFLSGATNGPLRDDGLDQDRQAGDSVFTSALIRFNTNYIKDLTNGASRFYNIDPFSPAGIRFEGLVFDLSVIETNGLSYKFLIEPSIGLMNPELPIAKSYLLNSNVQITAHLINLRGTNRWTQKSIRSIENRLENLTRQAYAVLPDAFDFFMFLSIDHLEYLPYSSGPNFAAGIHWTVKVNWSGTGQGPWDATAWFGSSGRLLGLNILDSAHRGTVSYNAVHEILHQWGSYSSTALNDGSGHYPGRSSIGSLIGGNLWYTNQSGAFVRNCNEGRNGATHAALLDKYMMGLNPSSQVPLSRLAYETNYCDVPFTAVESTISMADLVAIHGSRLPGPATAQRNFNLGFLAESHGRLMTPVELTFYEILADHFTKPTPAGVPDLHLSWNWRPIDRYFGADSTWRSDVLLHIQPQLASIRQTSPAQITLTGSGTPGRSYSLQSSSNLAAWATISNKTASSNGSLSFVLAKPPSSASRFYRLSWP